tara:strand:+ start:511 stop:618 length:108 start_codon:yes stop_codon:yes gene_type:complete
MSKELTTAELEQLIFKIDLMLSDDTDKLFTTEENK